MDDRLSKEAHRALAEVLEPGEEVRASICGQYGSAAIVTDRRIHVFRRRGPVGRGSVASWPLRSVSAISFKRGGYGLLSVGLIGDPSEPTLTSPNAMVIQRAMVSPFKGVEEDVEALRRAVAAGQQAAIANGEEVDAGPLGDQLAHLTQVWALPIVTRTYEGSDAGRRSLETETQVLGLHGYTPASQSEDGGHIHAGRLLMTGGLSVLAGGRGTRAKGSITVTFHKAQAAPPAPAAADPIEQLRKLGELRDAGVLTDAEFETKKAELLARL
jgi:Short C-terminal domain